MPLQSTSGAASYDAFGGGTVAKIKYIEDYFSTFLYSGAGTTQVINNGIDLSTNGGLVWLKDRGNVGSHRLVDTVRGNRSTLFSESTSAAVTRSDDVSCDVSLFNTNGFTAGNFMNQASNNYVSWSWAKAPKFFDVLTYTGDGNTFQTISHNLGSEPGCVIVKQTNASTNWVVYHRGIGTDTLRLNLTNAKTGIGGALLPSPTNIDFYGSGGADPLNASGGTYVAYLFAHNAGGFGLTGTDNVISCGSFTTDGSSNFSATLGYEPQWVMIKRYNTTGNWLMFDNMRGMGVQGISQVLYADVSNAEAGPNDFMAVNSTGFNGTIGSASQSYIYIAIRRGPMKVPTDATKVFSPIAITPTNNAIQSMNFVSDMNWARYRDLAGNGTMIHDRLRGFAYGTATSGSQYPETGLYLQTTTTNAENNNINPPVYNVWNNQLRYGDWAATTPTSFYNFGRAPSFMDVVCYTGDDAAPRTLSHNLGVAPELLITKRRSAGGTTGTNRWYVTAFNLPLSGPNYQSGILNGTDAFDVYTQIQTAPTSTTFTLGVDSFFANISPQTYVAYLFATCAGVSKVGSYTGTGTTLQVNCGFTGGARFVLIKRTDSTGDWYVWDSARGIVSGNDPYLLLNSSSAEVTSTDYIDTYSAGFEISSSAPSAINASGGTFIFLAIA